MIDPHQFLEIIIRPTLLTIGLWSAAAENLVLGTAIHESRLIYLRQIGGPALGLYQMEPATHEDIWDNVLDAHSELCWKVSALLANSPAPVDQLETNLAYATAMCRVAYWRVPGPLPDASDIDGLAAYWKQHYNTRLGAGDPSVWAKEYRDFMKQKETP